MPHTNAALSALHSAITNNRHPSSSQGPVRKLLARPAVLGSAQRRALRDCAVVGPHGAARASGWGRSLSASPNTPHTQKCAHTHLRAGRCYWCAATPIHPLGDTRTHTHTHPPTTQLDLGDSGIAYEPGDAIGFTPHNSPELVDKTLKRLGKGGDAVFSMRPRSGAAADTGGA
jgi:hypothetical protein